MNRPPAYRLGDRLRVARPRSVLLHEGLYAGRGSVIHVQRGGVAEYTTLSKFARGGIIEVVRRPSSPLEGQRIVAGARRHLGRPYKPFTFNCQHLVNEAITGRPSSPTLVAVAVLVIVAIAVWVAGRLG